MFYYNSYTMYIYYLLLGKELNLYALIKVQAYYYWLAGSTYCNRGRKLIKMDKEGVHVYVLPEDRN